MCPNISALPSLFRFIPSLLLLLPLFLTFALSFVPNCFRYRQLYTISSATFGPYDTRLVIDTAPLISSSKLRSDCSDMRFRQESSEVWLDFFYEGSCDDGGSGVIGTRVWVTPIFAGGMVTIGVYYGCRTPGGVPQVPEVGYGYEEDWTGSFIVLYRRSGISCGGGVWGLNPISDFEDRFILSSSVRDDYAVIESTKTLFNHQHTVGGSTDPASGAVFAPYIDGLTAYRAASEHTHFLSTLDVSVPSPSAVPPWQSFKFCASRYFDMGPDLIVPLKANFGLSNVSWSHFTSQNGYLLVGGVSSSQNGGDLSHTHGISGQTDANSAGPQVTLLTMVDANVRAHTHLVNPGTTTTPMSNLPTHYDVVFALATTYPLASEYDPSILVFVTGGLPPKGFVEFDTFDGAYLMGADTFAGPFTPPSDHHTAALAFMQGQLGQAGSSIATPPCTFRPHTHTGSYTSDDDPDRDDLDRVEIRLASYVSWYEHDGISSAMEFAYDCDGIYWDDPTVCNSRGSCDGETGSCSCDLDPTYGDVFHGTQCELVATCGPYIYSNPLVCSGNGSCTQPNKCICDVHYSGGLCEDEEQCGGIPWNHPDVCNQVGDCTGGCQCRYGYGGTLCELYECDSILETQPGVCSSSGNCTGVDICECNDVTIGEFCERPISCGFFDWDDNRVCWGRGECRRNGTNGVCTCVAPYAGDLCEIAGCAGLYSNDPDVCRGRGICFSSDLCACRMFRSWGTNCDELLPQETVEITLESNCEGLKKESESFFYFDVAYVARIFDVPGEELNGLFNCSSRILSSSTSVVGLGALCEWIMDLEVVNYTAAVRIRVFDCEAEVAQPGTSVMEFDLLTPLLADERASVTAITTLKNVVGSRSNLALLFGVLFPLVALLIIASLVVGGLVCCIAVCAKRIKRYDQLEDFDILLKEQEHNKGLYDGSRAQLRINSKAFEIDFTEITLLRVIGTGGSDATIFVAIYRGTNVAVKLFRVVNSLSDQLCFEEFEREVEILGSLLHPHILRFFGATLKNPRIGIVMEWCENGDLARFLVVEKMKRSESYPLSERLRLLREICSAMEYVHGQQVMHRDLKPENCLVTKSCEIRVMDFGLSKVFEAESYENTQRIGTRYYMAPEVFLGRPYSKSCDAFALAMILYVVIADLRTPFGEEYVGMNVDAKIALDSTFRPTFENFPIFQECSWVIPLITRGWAEDPDERPTMEEFLSVLEKESDPNFGRDSTEFDSGEVPTPTSRTADAENGVDEEDEDAKLMNQEKEKAYQDEITWLRRCVKQYQAQRRAVPLLPRRTNRPPAAEPPLRTPPPADPVASRPPPPPPANPPPPPSTPSSADPSRPMRHPPSVPALRGAGPPIRRAAPVVPPRLRRPRGGSTETDE